MRLMRFMRGEDRRLQIGAAIVVTFSSVASATYADGDCTAEFPKTAEAIVAWEQARSVALVPSVMEMVLQEFCGAAKEFAVEKNLAHSVIDQRGRIVIDQFLDRVNDPKSAGRTMGATLRSVFGASGLSQPKAKRLARLGVNYSKKVDAVKVGTSTLMPAATFIVPIGKLEVVGLFEEKPVCSAILQILAAIENKFDC